MASPTGVSRRLQQCIERLQAEDCEGALVNLFPAIDKTAKKRRPKAKVGHRIRSFLKDEEVLITSVGTGNIFKGNVFNGMTFEDALYKFGRTPIAHEGELDPRLNFHSNNGVQIGGDHWNLPTSYIVGMAMAVITAPENDGERTAEGLTVNIFNKKFELNEIWGKPDPVRSHICEVFQDPQLFK